MRIDPKYNIGDTVYIITDKEQNPNIITGIIVRPGNNLLYKLSTKSGEQDYFDIEISNAKDIILATSN